MLVSIHQPNFFPWLQYFQKVALSDTFVILDDVQFTKGNWINRCRTSILGAGSFVTIPVHYKSGQELADIKVTDQYRRVLNKLQLSIQQNFKNEPGCELMLELLSDISGDLNSNKSLLLCNINLLKRLFALFQIKTPIRFSSAFDVNGAKKTERIKRLLECLNCTEYLTGVGGLGYLERSFFKQFDVQVISESQGASVENCIDFLLRFGSSSGSVFNQMLDLVATEPCSLET